MTLSTINTVQFKPLILWINAGYGNGVKIPTPQLRLRVINRALYFTYGKGTWGGGAYYLWGACCMRGNTVPICQGFTLKTDRARWPFAKKCSRHGLVNLFTLRVPLSVSSAALVFLKITWKESENLQNIRRRVVVWHLINISPSNVFRKKLL